MAAVHGYRHVALDVRVLGAIYLGGIAAGWLGATVPAPNVLVGIDNHAAANLVLAALKVRHHVAGTKDSPVGVNPEHAIGILVVRRTRDDMGAAVNDGLVDVLALGADTVASTGTRLNGEVAFDLAAARSVNCRVTGAAVVINKLCVAIDGDIIGGRARARAVAQDACRRQLIAAAHRNVARDLKVGIPVNRAGKATAHDVVRAAGRANVNGTGAGNYEIGAIDIGTIRASVHRNREVKRAGSGKDRAMTVAEQRAALHVHVVKCAVAGKVAG